MVAKVSDLVFVFGVRLHQIFRLLFALCLFFIADVLLIHFLQGTVVYVFLAVLFIRSLAGVPEDVLLDRPLQGFS